MKLTPKNERYDMPQDMDYLLTATLTTDTIVYWPVTQISYPEIKRLFDQNKKSYPEGMPHYCALTLGMPITELILFPIPDKPYELILTYQPKKKQL